MATTLNNIPTLLETRKALELSDKIYKASSCFPFLNPTKELIVYHPKKNENPFYVIVCGLYALYHDFGKYALPWFLKNISDKNLRTQLIQHKTLIETLRGYIAHGTYDFDMNKVVCEEINRNSSLRISQSINNWKSNEWNNVCQHLTTESNRLYQYLDAWPASTSATLEDFQSIYDKLSTDGELLRQCTKSVEEQHGNVSIKPDEIKYKLEHIKSELCSIKDSPKTELIKKMKDNQSGKTKDLYSLIVNECDAILYPSTTKTLMSHL